MRPPHIVNRNGLSIHDYHDSNITLELELKKGLLKNKDGSYDIYFGPKPLKGKENNWIQSVPGKGWHTIFRLYGPLQPFYDKTWLPSDPAEVE